jgi:hypothetical protein
MKLIDADIIAQHVMPLDNQKNGCSQYTLQQLWPIQRQIAQLMRQIDELFDINRHFDC